MPLPPEDVTVGEVYRLVQRVEGELRELGTRLEAKALDAGIYAIAHEALKSEVARLRSDFDAFNQNSKSRNTAMIAALIAGISSVPISVIITITVH